jgi:hypothetical protein
VILIEIEETCITLQLANKEVICPVEIVTDVEVLVLPPTHNTLR